MKLATLAARNLLRNRFRSAMTVLAVALAVLVITILQTVSSAWHLGIEATSKDRIVSRNFISPNLMLPGRYVEEIRRLAGVRTATVFTYFGGRDPHQEHLTFGSAAVDGRTFLEVIDDIDVSREDYERWMEDRRGALIGDALAREHGWHVGDKVTLVSTRFPGSWDFNISGLYHPRSNAVNRSMFAFHWRYLNDSLDTRFHDRVSWIITRASDPKQSAQLCRTIDKMFESRDVQTFTQDQRQSTAASLGAASALFIVVRAVSLVILFVMMLIIGNTLAMAARERTSEYAVLRAIGFLPHHVVTNILGEAVAIGSLGGALGLLIAYPFIERWMSRWLEETLGPYSIFHYFHMSWQAAAIGIGAAILASGLAAWPSARKLRRLRIVEALRRIE